ncbi:MAG: NAD(P)H-binding protein [Bacteriovorax sp.]|nr:NAD(P)H-binding protein [Bacteriovorax sp.]
MSRILIAGASGFVGKALIKSLEADTSLSIVALSRQKNNVLHSRLEWRQADLFSLKDIAESMQGCDQAVYLVHSMLPSASLVQGTFYDLDLILADNFARAAKINNISHIIYLGGLLPRDQSNLSWHLKSRLEVEECLRNTTPELTILRAGMVLGEGGSSFVIMRRLVERLPVMLCPSWTKTLAQPIDLNDLILVFKKCISDPAVQGKTWDVGGNKILSYQQMMKLTADILNKKLPFFSINIFYPTLSWLWVTLITGAPKALVYPLVQSLRHSMLVRDEARFPFLELTATPIEESIARLVSKKEEEVHAFQTPVVLKAPKHVRSVQRLPLPRGRDAAWVADEYFKWLPGFFSFIIKTKVRNRLCTFYFLHPKITLLLLEKSIDRSTSDRQLLYIKGGLFAAKQTRARLEFREVLEKKYIIAGIHDFRPALPWIVYKYTQAIVHLIVMKSFARHLKKLK